jgi:ribose 5-phosphate isomerase A
LDEKKKVGEKAIDFVKEGMVVGLGTGTTVLYAISKLGKLVQQGFNIKGIPTSKQTEKLAIEVGIPLVSFNEIDHIDLAIDGADEVNPELDLIKGGGGALLREKIIAKAANNFIVVADSQKVVNKLGAFPLPVEVVPFGFRITMKHIRELGGSPKLRQKNGVPFITDNGNYIIDCVFSGLMFTEYLEKYINMISGVVDNGLFIGMADSVITLDRDKNIIIYERGKDWIRTEKCI